MPFVHEGRAEVAILMAARSLQVRNNVRYACLHIAVVDSCKGGAAASKEQHSMDTLKSDQ